MDIVKLVDYNHWASKRLLDQIGPLPQELFTKELGGSYPSLRLTLVHLMESDWIWMHRWDGVPLKEAPADWDTRTAASIAATWWPIQERMKRLAESWAKKPGEAVHFITRKGDPYRMPFNDIALHVSHHGAYHRGQLVNMLRQTPANTDFFIYCALAKK